MKKPQSYTQQGPMLLRLTWLQYFITGWRGWVTLESVFLREAPASTRSWQMARWRWQAALCNAVSPLDQSTETSSETHHTNVHLWSMRCRGQTEKDAVFLRGSLLLAEADLCTLSLSIYILWLGRKACNAQIADEELLRGGKETCTGFMYSKDQLPHSHPTTSSANCWKIKLAAFLFHSRQKRNSVWFFLYFFPQLHSGMHHRKILPIEAMTGALAALVPIRCSLVHMRARAVFLFSTAGLVSYWGSFSKEKAV